MKIELTKEQIEQLTEGQISQSNREYKLSIQAELFQIKEELETTLKRVNNLIKNNFEVKKSYSIDEKKLILLYNKGLTIEQIVKKLELPSGRGLAPKINYLVKQGKLIKRDKDFKGTEIKEEEIDDFFKFDIDPEQGQVAPKVQE